MRNFFKNWEKHYLVAVLPICGISCVMDTGYVRQPCRRRHSWHSQSDRSVSVGAGGALIDNMAIPLCYRCWCRYIEKNDGTGGIAALASWADVLTTLLLYRIYLQPSCHQSLTMQQKLCV